jgi:hypothetical protein
MLIQQPDPSQLPPVTNHRPGRNTGARCVSRTVTYDNWSSLLSLGGQFAPVHHTSTPSAFGGPAGIVVPRAYAVKFAEFHDPAE